MKIGETESGPGRNVFTMKAAWARLLRIVHTLREFFLKTGYFLSSAIMIPYCIWVFYLENVSFSRIPVIIGVLLLCVVTFFLYFSTKIRFRFRFSWWKTLLAALLFVILGISFAAVLSIILFSYLCEAVNYRRERRGQMRLSFSPNLGVGLVAALALVMFPLLNEMYYRGAQVKIWSSDYNKQNYFYEINENGYRGPKVAIKRSDTPRLLFLGDSTAFGWPYRYEESYPFMVKAILEARGFDVEIVNAATVGQSIGQIRQQLPYYLEYQPDVVFLMSGIHYLRADEDFQRILEEGVSRETRWRPFLFIPPMLVEIVIFSIKTSPLFATDSQDKKGTLELESFEKHLRAVVQETRDSGTHLYLVDYPTPGAERRVQDEIRRIGQETETDYIPLFDLIGNDIKHQIHDTIHPNRQGHRLIAEEIAKVAANALGRSRQP